MQGYDSYFMDTDIQLGGTDQTFNMQAGRILQKDLRNKESFIIANGFLAGTDGRKMSKSWGNAIWLDDEPKEMYGKVMSLKDNLIINYFTLATSVSLEEISTIESKLKADENPMTFKKQLALQLVTELHSKELAEEAQTFFESTVQNKEIPDEIEELQIEKDTSILEALKLANLGVSNADIKRTLEQNGVEVDGVKVSDPQAVVTGKILKFGKRTYRKIIFV